MGVLVDRETTAARICERLGQYFGNKYDISSNSNDVFTIKSRLKPCVYVESEDILIVNNIAGEFGMGVEKWRLVVANGQVGIYCVLKDEASLAGRMDLVSDSLKPATQELAA